MLMDELLFGRAMVLLYISIREWTLIDLAIS